MLWLLARKKIITKYLSVTVVFKRYFIKLTINNKRLHFETNLWMNCTEEVSCFQKIMVIWWLLQFSIFWEIIFSPVCYFRFKLMTHIIQYLPDLECFLLSTFSDAYLWVKRELFWRWFKLLSENSVAQTNNVFRQRKTFFFQKTEKNWL